jgi:ring-1,2-phenylacetyl-CoA epoxidase subunit PaaC
VSAELREYVLRLGDTALVHAQRLGEWVGHAPALEEDLALGNLALDFLGQARLLLSYAAELEGCGRSEDDLAYLRDQNEFRNFTLVEQPNSDFGLTITRQFFLDAFQMQLFAGLQRSSDARLAAIAAKALKEAQYHHRFSANWLLRLGDGTAESHARAQAAVDALWRYTAEFFAVDDIDTAMAAQSVAPLPTEWQKAWASDVRAVLSRATLQAPAEQRGAPCGKRGQHSEHLGYVLAELQFMQRAYPGAQW